MTSETDAAAHLLSQLIFSLCLTFVKEIEDDKRGDTSGLKKRSQYMAARAIFIPHSNLKDGSSSLLLLSLHLPKN